MSARIVYMGTPEFAVGPLEALIHSEHEVVAVVTVPDKPSGRGQKIHESAVKKAAKAHNIPVLQPEKLRDERFQSELAAFQADLFVVVAFRMLPKSVWSIPPKGTFNLHASLLPAYRGAAPIHWAVMNGESESGVTTFLIDEEIDTGNILLQEKVAIASNETTGELYYRLMNVGSALVVRTVTQWMNGTLLPISQKEEQDLKPAPKLFREHQLLDFSNSAEHLHNQVRGLTPFPPALIAFTLDGEIFEAKVSDSSFSIDENLQNGPLQWDDDALKIQTSEGILLIRQIQWPGKRKMTIRDFKNGFADLERLELS